MNQHNAVAEAFKEIGRVVRIFSVGGRRVERFLREQTQRWVEPSFGVNRAQRRNYLAQLRKAGKAAKKEKEQFVRYVLNLERVR